MLTLDRREGQSITIGGNIEITVVRIGVNYVRIGITAPRDVPIVRDDAIRKEKKE